MDQPGPFINRLLIDALKATSRETGQMGTAAYKAVFAFPLEKKLPQVLCPTLVIWGSRDIELHQQEFGIGGTQHYLAVGQLIPNCEVVTIEDARASSAIVNLMPNEFSSVILEFLSRPQTGNASEG
jgi:pimeloyl-ACP methyl ester carboxylesterase